LLRAFLGSKLAPERKGVEMNADIKGFRGELITADHPGYDTARAVWNGAIDRRPAIIAACLGAADVAAAVAHAREHDMLASVRGGGHGVAGVAVNDGGMVIDCSRMRGVFVDPAARTAHVQAGALLGDLDAETQAFGLAAPAGIITHTGVAGLTLGGGIGWLMRKHGLTIDNLASCRVVTADGEMLRAAEDENPDLFWGLRGGGGNFGVVTSFEFDLHPVGPTVFAGPVYWAMEEAAEVLRFYRDFIATAPDELTTIVFLRRAPALPIIPAELHGKQVVYVGCCYAGPIEDGERVLEPLRRYGKPLLDLIGPKPFIGYQSIGDPTARHGWHYYWKSTELTELKDDMIDIIADHSSRIASPLSYALIFQLGGAIARVPEDATAYSHRTAAHNININGVWLPEEARSAADPETAWARGLFHDLEPYQAGVYVNFLADEGEDRVRAAYGAKYERLRELKRRYDPTNFFRMNQNIKP
jgi:FAD/FMN-containing dehydrogenase